jgi:tRNA nucleotidyltransferase (CCA-adding enzyme)
VSRTANLLIRPTVPALRRALPPGLRSLLDAATSVVRATPGGSLWAVGGPVRDLAAGLPVRDLDLATNGDAGALARAVAARLDGTSPGNAVAHVEPRFGTASVTYSGHCLDLVALRSERYARPGALPTVRLGATIEADLARRDFTVNAIALGLAGPARGRLIDPSDGLADLAARRLRVLHERSFFDDATRLWRAARFAARLSLRLDPDTTRLVAEAVRSGALDPIAPRRLWREWTLLAAEPRAGAACPLLERWGVLRATHPALRLAPLATHALMRLRGLLIPGAGDSTEAPDVLYALVVAPLRAPARAAVAARLGAPRTAVRAAEAAAGLLTVPAATPAALARVEGAPRAARIAAHRLDPVGQPSLQRALARWERTRSPLDARTLITLGVAPGPALGAMLARLRRARYLGTLVDAGTARERVQRWRDAALRRPDAPPVQFRRAP